MINHKDIIKIDTTPSTNKYATELLKKDDIADFTLIYTDNQTNGRGQRNNIWESEASKNLTFSIIIFPNYIEASKQFIISQAVSMGIIDYCKLNGIDAFVKWPNDIYVGDKKICGILIENTLMGTSIRNAVVGIGFNLNQEQFSSWIPNATSLKCETGKEFNTQNELLNIANCVKERYDTLSLNDFEPIIAQYTEKLYRVNEFHEFKESDITFKGKITGVESNGKLQVQMEDGEQKSYAFKEVEFVI